MRFPLHAARALLALITVACLGYGGLLGYGQARRLVEGSPPFDGAIALEHVEQQILFGPRLTGSRNSVRFRNWLTDLLGSMGWKIHLHVFQAPEDRQGVNVLAARGEGPTILLGAHYDSRLLADEDPEPDLRSRPVPGANDGASGVAVLLELARVLDIQSVGHEVCLAFFDAEDNGNIPGWSWILGSEAYANALADQPRCGDPIFVIIVDMVGDLDQRIPLERNSTPELSDAIWRQAAELGYGAYLVPEPKYRIIDDHLPFLQRGIPAIVIIDFDYPYWHTTADTLDKVGAESLERVGRTLETWLENGAVWENPTAR